MGHLSSLPDTATFYPVELQHLQDQRRRLHPMCQTIMLHRFPRNLCSQRSPTPANEGSSWCRARHSYLLLRQTPSSTCVFSVFRCFRLLSFASRKNSRRRVPPPWLPMPHPRILTLTPTTSPSSPLPTRLLVPTPRHINPAHPWSPRFWCQGLQRTVNSRRGRGWSSPSCCVGIGA